MRNTVINKETPFVHIFIYLMVLGLFLILISRDFFSEGLSQVGLENAIRSKNIDNTSMADFWSRDNGLTTDNRDYLPLGYYLEGRVLSQFEDSYMLEKGFSMMIFILCGFLIVRVWNLLGMSKSSGWMPLAFWILSPIVCQSSTQNLIELPLTFFNLLALCMLCRLYKFRQDMMAKIENHQDVSLVKMRFVCTALSCLAALFLIVSFFIKGFSSTHLFFLPLIFWYFDSKEGIGQPLISLLIMTIFSSVVFLILCVSKSVVPVMLTGYLHNCFNTWSNPSNVVNNLWLVGETVRQTAIGYSFLAVVWIISMFKGEYAHYMTYWLHRDAIPPEKLHNIVMAYRLFVMALLGMIPVLFSVHPTSHYLLPLLPLVALACSFVSWNTVSDINDKGTYMTNIILALLSVMVFTAGLVLNYNSISKNNANGEVVSDMHEILPYLKEGEVVSATDEIYADKQTQIYFLRYKDIIFDSCMNHPYLVSKAEDAVSLNTKQKYERITPNTSRIHLYKVSDKKDWYQGQWVF